MVYFTKEERMLRQVMIPSKGNLTISIPAEYYGTEVEVLVFPTNNTKKNQTGDGIDDIFDKYLFSLASFKFDRDQANDYE